MTSEWLWTFSSKKYHLYTLSAYTWSPKFDFPFYSQPYSRYIYKVVKIRKIRNAALDPKMTLNTKESKLTPYTQYDCPRIPIVLPRFALRPAVFELQATFRQMHQTTSKSFLKLKDERYPIYIVQLLLVQNFTPFLSTASPFRVTGHFERSIPNNPKMTNKSWKIKST